MLGIDPEVRDQAYQLFSQEALDLLHTIEEGLLNLRADHSVSKVHDIMRAAHSIKGGSASVDLPGIQTIAHRLEDVFRALYKHEEIDLELEELLLQAFDSLRSPLLDQIQIGSYDEETAIAKADSIFDRFKAILGDNFGDDIELPTSIELGFDITEEVFKGDVAQSLERLEGILAHPDTEEVAGEITALAEVFAGIGEMLNLPGFTAIANQTLAALEAHPEAVQQIGQLALSNFLTAKAAVLAGDRAEGGSPSVALLALAQASGNGDLGAAIADRLAADLEGEQLTDFFGQADAELPAFTDPEVDNLADIFGQSDFGQPNFGQPDFGQTDLELNGFTDLEADNLADILDQTDLGQTDLGQTDLRDSDAEPIALANPEVLGDIFGQADTTYESIDSFDRGDRDDELIGSGDLEDIFANTPANGFAYTELIDVAEPAIAPEMPVNASSGNTAIAPDNQIAQPVENQVEKADKQAEVPTVAPVTTTPEKTANSTPAIARSPETKGTPYMTGAVRVDLSRLERLNNLVGEMVTQENSALLQSQQLQGTLGQLQKRFNHFERLTKELENWMSKSQTSEVRSRVTSSFGFSEVRSQNPSSFGMADFDPLQMDSYNRLYLLMQEALEEIAQMGENMQDMNLLAQQSQQTQRKKQQTLKQVRNDLLWARMMPLGDILQRFPRMIRDLASKYQKKINFKTVGGTTLVDKAVLERLYDPLVHLIRNAFDHGTELPEARIAQGKPAEATIEIRAYHRGNQTYIEVRDDGKGIDLEKVRKAAVAQGVLSSDAAATASQEQLYECLFSPSFSTASTVSELSGRGMGLNDVRSQVTFLKGTIAIASEPGQGTVFTIRLPLTLTIAKLLVFNINAHLMAIPVDTLLAIITAPDSDIQMLQGRQFYRYQDRLIPLYPQSSFSDHYPLPKNILEQPRSMALPQTGRVPLLIVSSGSEAIALEVDHVLNEQELVIKPFGRAITPPSYLYGCTILGDGSLLPVIDGSALIASWQRTATITSSSNSQSVDAETAQSPGDSPAGTTVQSKIQAANLQTILVVDDSLTTRQTLTLTLRKSGYHVVQAADGREALEQLKQEPGIQAVFCDVEMPKMNGFEFLSQCRPQYPKSSLPVIMLTSRGGEKHRSVAKLLGATAYLTKPYLEQDLLKTLKEVINQPLVSAL